MMTKQYKDILFYLLKSLSKSEKRHFKLYVGRLGVNEESKFLTLFNIMDKMPVYDENSILKNSIITKQQLSNIKAHLYRQILISLRLNPALQDLRSQIREQLDFASILYHKGLYKQGLRILDKAKENAFSYDEKILAFEILELEKIIETQYITKSADVRSEYLISQSETLLRQNELTSKLSSLSLFLYNTYLKTGYIKNPKELLFIKQVFESKMPKFEIQELGFREKMWLYKSYVWYSFLTQNFLYAYKYAKKWVDLFLLQKPMIQLHPVFFLKGYQYLLEALFYLRQYQKFKSVLNELIDLSYLKSFPKDDNIDSLRFLYIYTHKINLCFMEGAFQEGLTLVDPVLKGIGRYKYILDQHYIMVFYYKIACIYFGLGKNEECITYLNKIIDNKSLEMRVDLLCFSRILNLVAHFEAGMQYGMQRQLKLTYKFLLKMEDLYEVQKTMLEFLKNLGDIYPDELQKEFRKLHQKLSVYKEDPYQRRAFLYLDILSWLESRIEGLPVAKILERKHKQILKTNDGK